MQRRIPCSPLQSSHCGGIIHTHQPAEQQSTSPRQLIFAFFKDESGQDLIEYALVVGLIGLAGIAGLKGLSSNVANFFNSLGSKLINAT